MNNHLWGNGSSFMLKDRKAGFEEPAIDGICRISRVYENYAYAAEK